MTNIAQFRLETHLIGSAIMFTTLFFSQTAFDSFNLPKLAVLLVFAASLLPLAMGRIIEEFRRDRFALWTILFMLLAVLVTFLSDGQNLNRKLIGAYFRSNGTLTYLSLIVLCLSSYFFVTKGQISLILNYSFFTLLLVTIYGYLQLLGRDFVKWDFSLVGTNLPIATFGNQNFSSAFLGFMSIIFVRFVYNKKLIWISIIGYISCIYLTIKTGSVQGTITALITLFLFLIFQSGILRKLTLLQLCLSGTVILSFAGLMFSAALGKIQQLDFLTQPTLQIRQAYWSAALNMFFDNPFVGVGVDAYGESYRLFRDLKDMEYSVSFSNNAHNLLLQFLATGGIILGGAYLALILFTFLRGVRFLRNNKSTDITFSIVFSIWLGFQVQSLISIDQIGLSVWNWTLMGVILSLSRYTEIPNKARKEVNYQKLKKNSKVGIQIFSGASLVILALIFSIKLVSSNMDYKVLRNESQILKAGDLSSFGEDKLSNLFGFYKGSAEYGRLIAAATYKLGQIELGDAFTRELLSLHMNSYEINEMQAQVLIAKGMGKESLVYAEKLTKLDPYATGSWTFYSQVLTSLDLVEEAKAVLIKGSRIAFRGRGLLEALSSIDEEFRVGDVIVNSTYGKGYIEALEFNGDQTLATIIFDELPEKRFKLNISSLDKYVENTNE